MRKLVAALACRNQGSRLYGKPLQNLDIEKGISIIDNIVDCLHQFNQIEEVVLGISEGIENEIFSRYASEKGLRFIVGDQKDVLHRLIQCGELGDATDIFRMTSESPFPYFQAIDESWEKHKSNNVDATFLDNIIDGCGFEIIKLDALKQSHHEGEDRHRSELCTLYIRENKSKFSIQYIEPPQSLSRKDIRFTVDYPEDLIVCRAVYEKFSKQAPLIPLLEAVRIFEEQPDLIKLIAPYCEEGYNTMYL